MVLERLAQQRQPTRELTAHDAMLGVCLTDGTPRVLEVGTQKVRGVLVLEALRALAARAREEEADHQIVEAAVHEVVDQRAQRRLTTQSLEVGHGCTMGPSSGYDNGDGLRMRRVYPRWLSAVSKRRTVGP